MSDPNIEGISAAKNILSWRPGIQSDTLPSKGGPKYFGSHIDNTEEKYKVNTQLEKYASVLYSKKVRKIGNLGCAEWISNQGVAEITKQGKFMQSMGHYNGEFFALYAEEALFLLDIGDLELHLNGVPMAMQEAFATILNNDKSCCNLSEYQVFAHLVKRGYYVQRFASLEGEEKKTAKRILETDEVIDSDQAKRLKENYDEFMHLSDKTSGISSMRGWNIQTVSVSSTHSSSNSTRTLHILFLPNLSNQSNTHLPQPDSNLIPSNTEANEYNIDEIWYQRIQKDTGDAQKTLQYTFSNSVNFGEIARKAKTWCQYKQMVKAARQNKCEQSIKLSDKMHSGAFKPLLHPSHATTVDQVCKKIKLEKEPGFRLNNLNQQYTIKYNIYKSDSAPFKKTDPGTPFSRIIVTTVQDEFPDLRTITSVDNQSNGVPVKYAIVDFGQISFFVFDRTGAPTILKDL